MGIEYRLYHHPSKTYVHLGKGPWYILQEALKGGGDALTIAQDLLGAWCYPGREDLKGWATYTLWVLCRSLGFAHTGRWSAETMCFEDVTSELSAEVLADHADDLWLDWREPDWTKVGERYGPPEDMGAEEVGGIIGFLLDDLLTELWDEMGYKDVADG